MGGAVIYALVESTLPALTTETELEGTFQQAAAPNITRAARNRKSPGNFRNTQCITIIYLLPHIARVLACGVKFKQYHNYTIEK